MGKKGLLICFAVSYILTRVWHKSKTSSLAFVLYLTISMRKCKKLQTLIVSF